MHINIARLLHTQVSVAAPLRPEVTVHRNRRGFIERQDGSWIFLPIHSPVQRRQNKPKARRRLWNWLANVAAKGKTAQEKGVVL